MRHSRTSSGSEVLFPESEAEAALTAFERQVAESLLGSDPKFECAREQLTTARVVSREFTGAGAYTHLMITGPAGDPQVFVNGMESQGILIETSQCKIGACLLASEGRISAIEYYSFDEPWLFDFARAVVVGEDSSVRITVFPNQNRAHP